MPAARLLRAVREVLAGEIADPRRATCEVEDHSDGARVRVDAEQIQQLLLNLVQNALAATEESGRPPVVRLSAPRQGPRVELAVADNGAGMSAEETGARMFDLFYSTRKGGTGLGLAIVDRIARAHGGGDLGRDRRRAAAPRFGSRCRSRDPAPAERARGPLECRPCLRSPSLA